MIINLSNFGMHFKLNVRTHSLIEDNSIRIRDKIDDNQLIHLNHYLNLSLYLYSLYRMLTKPVNPPIPSVSVSIPQYFLLIGIRIEIKALPPKMI